jgi:hypothetical protein
MFGQIKRDVAGGLRSSLGVCRTFEAAVGKI